MKRRDFLKIGAGLGTGLGAFTTLPLQPASAQAKTVFKASDVQPAGYPTVAATESIGKKLEAATNGRLSIQMYPSAQLGAEKETIEQTQIGAIQLLRVSAGTIGPIVPALTRSNWMAPIWVCSMVSFSAPSWAEGYIWIERRPLVAASSFLPMLSVAATVG